MNLLSSEVQRVRTSRASTAVVISLFVGVASVLTLNNSVVKASSSTAAFYVSAPGVEGPGSLTGLTMETFDSLSAGVKGVGTALAIGTISANSLTVHNCSGATCWAGAATSSSTPIPSVFNLPASTPNPNYPDSSKTPFAYPVSRVTIDLIRPVNYFGFYWAAGSGSNTVKLFTDNTLVASFSTADLNTLIPTSRVASGATVAVNGGGVYNVDNYRGGHKSAWDSWYTAAGVNCALNSPGTWSVTCWNPQQFAYVHAVVPQGATFNKVELISSDFEFDNLAIANYTGTFDPNGLVGVPLSNASQAPTLSVPATTTSVAPTTSTLIQATTTTVPTSTTSVPVTTTQPVASTVGAASENQLPTTGKNALQLLIAACGLVGTGLFLTTRRRARY